MAKAKVTELSREEKLALTTEEGAERYVRAKGVHSGMTVHVTMPNDSRIPADDRHISGPPHSVIKTFAQRCRELWSGELSLPPSASASA